MNLSEVLTSKVISGYGAEPIVDTAGNVVAVNIRTESASPGGFFSNSGKAQKKKRLKDQLDLIDLKTAYFAENNILCSVCIDFDMAAMLIQDEELATLARSKPFLRLEISEGFPNLSDGRSNRVVQDLATQYRLWLGDLGSGESNLRALQENLYDAINIDNAFYQHYSNSRIWPVIIKNITRYCKVIIVEGSDSAENYYYDDEGLTVLQRGCFDRVCLENIESLNNKFIL